MVFFHKISAGCTATSVLSSQLCGSSMAVTVEEHCLLLDNSPHFVVCCLGPLGSLMRILSGFVATRQDLKFPGKPNAKTNTSVASLEQHTLPLGPPALQSETRMMRVFRSKQALLLFVVWHLRCLCKEQAEASQVQTFLLSNEHSWGQELSQKPIVATCLPSANCFQRALLQFSQHSEETLPNNTHTSWVESPDCSWERTRVHVCGHQTLISL